MSQKLVFHQSKCICAIKRIPSTTAMYVSSSSFMYLRIPCYCDACLNSSALRVGVTTLLNTIQYNELLHDVMFTKFLFVFVRGKTRRHSEYCFALTRVALFGKVNVLMKIYVINNEARFASRKVMRMILCFHIEYAVCKIVLYSSQP